MIMGENRDVVIDNIRKAAAEGDFSRKVEPGDPALTSEESNQITNRYLETRNSAYFRLKSFFARRIANAITSYTNRSTVIYGIEKIPAITGGAVVTSNHFSPLENTVIRKLARKCGKRRINVVSQVTNLAMTGLLGFLMNYADIIPLSSNPHYMERDFISVLSSLFKKNEWVLIYPEQEMWFQYRKPRPPKRGAYYFASQLNVPVISCFVEIVDTAVPETSEFNRVRYKLHVLDTLYPDPDKSPRENSIALAKQDYELKKAAYEACYDKPLCYDTEPDEIAGWKKAVQEN